MVDIKPIRTKEPKEPEQAQAVNTDIKPDESKSSKQAAPAKPAPEPPKPQVQVDPYYILFSNMKVETPYDMAAWKEGEGANVLFVDSSKKSMFTIGFYLKAELIDKLYEGIHGKGKKV